MLTGRANLDFGKQEKNEEGTILQSKVRELRKVNRGQRGRREGSGWSFFWLLRLFHTKSVFENFAKSKGKKKTAMKGT